MGKETVPYVEACGVVSATRHICTRPVYDTEVDGDGLYHVVLNLQPEEGYCIYLRKGHYKEEMPIYATATVNFVRVPHPALDIASRRRRIRQHIARKFRLQYSWINPSVVRGVKYETIDHILTDSFFRLR